MSTSQSDRLDRIEAQCEQATVERQELREFFLATMQTFAEMSEQNEARMAQNEAHMAQNEAHMAQNEARIAQNEARIAQNEARMNQMQDSMSQMQANMTQLQNNMTQLQNNMSQMQVNMNQMNENHERQMGRLNEGILASQVLQGLLSEQTLQLKQTVDYLLSQDGGDRPNPQS